MAARNRFGRQGATGRGAGVAGVAAGQAAWRDQLRAWGMQAALRAVEWAEEGCWRAVEAVLRWPAWTAGVLAVAVATPWVSLTAVGITAGITLCSVGILAIWGGAARRKRAASLPEITKSSRRQRRFRQLWPEAMDRAKLTAAGRGPDAVPVHPQLQRVRMVAADHLTAMVDTSPTGTPAQKLIDARGVVLARMRAKTMQVTVLAPSQARIDVRWNDPLARIIRPSQLPLPADKLRPVIGLGESGEPVSVLCTLPQLAIGAQGAGKSSQLWAFLNGLRVAGVPVRLRVYDPKGGQEFGELEDVVHQYERNISGWANLVGAARKGLEARQAMLRRRGIRNFNEFTADEPLDILIIDELLTVKRQSSGKAGEKAAADLEHLLSQGRAAGYTVAALAQDGTKDVLGSIAELFPIRSCMRVVTDSMVSVALNVPASHAPAHQIPAERPGEAYIAQDGQVIRYRAAHMTRADIARVVTWLRRAKQHAERGRAA